MARTSKNEACLGRAPLVASPSDEHYGGDQEGILFALAEAIEQRDHHIAGHCQRLAYISVTLGIAMGLDRLRLLALYRGGYLHDVGKVGIPDSILFKPGALTAEEWVTMRSHSARGEEICRHLKSMTHVLPIIRHHHERSRSDRQPRRPRALHASLLCISGAAHGAQRE